MSHAGLRWLVHDHIARPLQVLDQPLGGEATNHPREIAEAALAHTLRDKVEAAYQRGDVLDKRRRLMGEWATFCARPALPAEVVPI